jgi:hypothetical protein
LSLEQSKVALQSQAIKGSYSSNLSWQTKSVHVFLKVFISEFVILPSQKHVMIKLQGTFLSLWKMSDSLVVISMSSINEHLYAPKDK